MPELPTSYAVLPNIPISSTAASTQRRNAAGGHGEQRRGESKGGGGEVRVEGEEGGGLGLGIE